MRSVNYSLYSDAGFSALQIDALISLLDRTKIHWLYLNENGVFEMVVDNQIMSNFRSCSAYGIEAFVESRGSRGREWNLEFGLAYHDVMEWYYTNFRNSDFKLENLIKIGGNAWRAHDLDFFASQKGYSDVGGILGFGALLVAYVQRFGPENERLRVIGTEISFGHGREVAIGSFVNQYSKSWLDLYLSGRIDVLVDDGTAICPMDHKTKTTLRRDPAQEYELDEGPTGYVYAMHKILPAIAAKLGVKEFLNRSCNKIIMNFISKTMPKEGDRFKRLPIMKTQEQLERYEGRMLLTGEKIFRTLVAYATGGEVERDTSKCTNWYMHDCPFVAVHRQNSKTNELAIINSFYEVKPVWDTEKVGKKEEGKSSV